MKQPQVGRVIHPDGTESTVHPADGKEFTLKELQNAVEGLIEIVFLKPGHGHATAYVNEEGKLIGLLPNHKATKLIRLFPGDYVAGNILIVSRVKEV